MVLTPRNVEITWNAVTCATGYLISYFSNALYATTHKRSVFVKDFAQTNYTLMLTDLEEHTEYTITVRVISDVGMSDNSNRVTVTTYTDGKHNTYVINWKCYYYYKCTVPSSPPQNVIVASFDIASLNITWEPPPEIHQNGQITGYVILHYCIVDGCSVEWSLVDVATSSLILSGLTPYVGYIIKIAATNVNGPGIFYLTVKLTGQQGM